MTSTHQSTEPNSTVPGAVAGGSGPSDSVVTKDLGAPIAGSAPSADPNDPIVGATAGSDGPLTGQAAVAVALEQAEAPQQKTADWAMPDLDALQKRTHHELTAEQLEMAKANSLELDITDRRAMLDYAGQEMKGATQFADDYYGLIQARDYGSLGEIQKKRHRALRDIGDKLKAIADQDEQERLAEQGVVVEEKSLTTRVAEAFSRWFKDAPESVAITAARMIDDFKITSAEMGEIIQGTEAALTDEKERLSEGHSRLEQSMEWGLDSMTNLTMRIVEAELALDREKTNYVQWVEEHQDAPRGIRLQLEEKERRSNLIGCNERLRTLQALHTLLGAGVLDMSGDLSQNALLQSGIDNDIEGQGMITRLHMVKVVANLENRRGTAILKSSREATGESIEAMTRDMKKLSQDIAEILEQGSIPVEKVIAFIDATIESSETTFQGQLSGLHRQREDAASYKDAMDRIAQRNAERAQELKADLEADIARRKEIEEAQQ